MIDSELKLYYDQIFQFCKSVVVKSELMALQMKDSVEKFSGTTIETDQENPYYAHLCGLYGSLDEPIYIIDDGSKVVLDRVLLNNKPWVRKKYNVYGTSFSKLVEDNPNREGFLRLLISQPCATIDEAINLEDFSLVYYDDSILEEQERHSIVEALKGFVKMFKDRWVVNDFAYEELYGLQVISVFYSLLPPFLLGKRIDNLKTQNAHTFHIWNHLSSYGLEDYRSILSIEQQLFLYKNIEYIMKNVGKHGTLAILIEKILEQNYLSIEPQMIVNEYPSDITKENLPVKPYVVARRFDNTPISEFFDSKSTTIEQFYDILYTNGFITENDYRRYGQVEDRLKVMDHTSLQTKFLELKRSLPQQPYVQFLFSMMVAGTICFLHEDRIKYNIPVIEEKLDFSELLSPKVAFLLLLYLLNKQLGVGEPKVPTRLKAYPFIRNYDVFIDTNIKTIHGVRKVSDFININQFKARYKNLDTLTEFNFNSEPLTLILNMAQVIVSDLYLCCENEQGLNEAVNQLHNQMFISNQNNEVSIFTDDDITMMDWFKTNAYSVYDLILDINNDESIDVDKLVTQVIEGFVPSSVLNDPAFNLNLSDDYKYTKLKQLFIQLCSYNVVFIDPNLRNQVTYQHDPLVLGMGNLNELEGLSDIRLINYAIIPYPNPDTEVGESDPLLTGTLNFSATTNDSLDFLIEYKLELSRNANFASIDKEIFGTLDLTKAQIGIKPNLLMPGTEYYARVSFRSRLFDWEFSDSSNILEFNCGRIVPPVLFYPQLSDTEIKTIVKQPTITITSNTPTPSFTISDFLVETTEVPGSSLILISEPMELTFDHEDLHVQSRWLVSEEADMSDVVHDSGWISDLTTYRIPWDKEVHSNIYFAVMYKGLRYGESALSNIASFEMRNIKKPVILSTVGEFNPLEYSILEIHSDLFACLGDFHDVHNASRWVIAIDEAMTKVIYDTDWDSENLIDVTTQPFVNSYSDDYKITTPVVVRTNEDASAYTFRISPFTFIPLLSGTTPDSVYITVQYKGVVLGLSDVSDPYRVYSTIQPRGNIRVNIEPGEVLASNPMWRRKGTLQWRPSGAMEEYLLEGAYTLEFQEVTGWLKPDDVVVNVIDDQTTTHTVTYVAAPLTGGIRVTILPEEAALRDGWWRMVDINGVWCPSGITVNDLPAGTYTIAFTEVEEYMVKDPIQVTVVGGQITEVTEEYARQGAKLRATLLPSEVVDAGGKWRLVGTTEWKNSGDQIIGLQSGTYSFEFLEVTNFFLPTPEPISVVNGDDISLTFTYGIIGIPVPVVEEFHVSLGAVVSARKRVPPTTVTVTIINGEEYIEPLSETVPYRSTATFDVVGGVVIKANDENIIVGGTAP